MPSAGSSPESFSQSGGDTLAELSAEDGQLDCLRELRAAGANLLAVDGKALCRACRRNQVETARYLLEEYGADLEAEYDDWTPLFFAAQSNAMECALLLLDAGAAPLHRAGAAAMRQLLKQYCRTSR